MVDVINNTTLVILGIGTAVCVGCAWWAVYSYEQEKKTANEDALANIKKLMGGVEFTPFKKTLILIDDDNRALEIILEDCSMYAEWIKGEGGDICIYRAVQDDRLVGARLPMKFPNVVLENEKV